MKYIKYFFICFKFCCLITAFVMVGYWIFKYSKDEDITVIEYKSFQDSDSINLPVISICFDNPFLINQSDFKTENYVKYLRGDMDFYDDHRNVPYDRVTLNIQDYLDTIMIYV